MKIYIDSKDKVYQIVRLQEIHLVKNTKYVFLMFADKLLKQ
jgi:hypothetical protein